MSPSEPNHLEVLEAFTHCSILYLVQKESRRYCNVVHSIHTVLYLIQPTTPCEHLLLFIRLFPISVQLLPIHYLISKFASVAQPCKSIFHLRLNFGETRPKILVPVPLFAIVLGH